MERLNTNRRPSGITVNALRTWGMLFLMGGIIGRGVLQTHILGVRGTDPYQLLQAMQSSPEVMTYVTVSLVLQAMETCAVPIFAMLMVNGVQHTSNLLRYALRVLGAAALTEIPYNLAVGGKLFDLSSRNPVFSLVLCFVVLYFFRRYGTGGFRNVIVRILVAVAALVWARMLNVEFGGPTLVIFCVLWAFREKPLLRNYAGVSAAIASSLFSPFFLASPMAFLAIHMCNWEKGEGNRILNYLMYPGMLLVAALACMYLF